MRSRCWLTRTAKLYFTNPQSHRIGRGTDELAAILRHRSHPAGATDCTTLVVDTIRRSRAVALTCLDARLTNLRSLLSLHHHLQRSRGPSPSGRRTRAVSRYGTAAIDNGSSRRGAGCYGTSNTSGISHGSTRIRVNPWLDLSLRAAEHIPDLSRCAAECVAHSPCAAQHIVNLSCDRLR